MIPKITLGDFNSLLSVSERTIVMTYIGKYTYTYSYIYMRGQREGERQELRGEIWHPTAKECKLFSMAQESLAKTDHITAR